MQKSEFDEFAIGSQMSGEMHGAQGRRARKFIAN